ncbi:MAG: PAS domain S-box protein, partial [Calditrichota bacterium]
ALALSFNYLSPAAERITGYSLDQLYAMGHEGFLTHIHPADVHVYLDHWSRMMDHRKKYSDLFSLEYRFIRSDGSVIWFADRGMPVTSGSGALLSVEGILRDVTELRSATEKLSTQTELLEAEVHRRSIELQESETRYRLLLAEAGDIIFTTDAHGRILDLNQRGRDLIGFKPEEINLKGFPNLLEENYRRRFNRTLRTCVEKGIRPDPYHIEYLNPRGRRLQLEIQSSPFIVDDKVIMVLHVARDLTGRRRSVQAIRALKERNEEMIRTMSEGILIENENGICEFVNPALAEMLGWTGAEMVGRPVVEFILPSERDYFYNQSQVRHLRGTTRFETKLITSENNILPVMISSRARYNEDREAGALSVITNLSVAKELERRHKVMERLLADERKLADIGMLAAGIAHNINNPLTSINGYLELIRARFPDCSECDAVAQQLRKIEAITKNLMVKSRSEQEKQVRPINLNDLINTELKFLEANLEFKSKVKRSVELDPNLVPINGVYSDFSQVFSNLVNNALDAMFGRPDKRLRIATRFTGKELWIEVEDSGKGIAPEHLDRIFTPFFTTKPPVSEQQGDAPVGTGLGLSTSQQLIAHYGGRIEAESELDKGALFRIIIPAPEKIEVISEREPNAYMRRETELENESKDALQRALAVKDI